MLPAAKLPVIFYLWALTKAELSTSPQIKNAAKGGSIYLVTLRGLNSNRILADLQKINALRKILIFSIITML
jgi:hypothetical protein